MTVKTPAPPPLADELDRLLRSCVSHTCDARSTITTLFKVLGGPPGATAQRVGLVCRQRLRGLAIRVSSLSPGKTTSALSHDDGRPGV